MAGSPVKQEAMGNHRVIRLSLTIPIAWDRVIVSTHLVVPSFWRIARLEIEALSPLS